LLFSDVEGSTRGWEHNPEAMSAAMARQQAAVAAAIRDRGGAIVKDTGDGLLAVFGAATDSVLAAVAAQRALQEMDWGETGPLRTRVGLHTGDVQMVGGDYHGPTVNRCARIMGAAHGGQVVLSDTTYARIGDMAPRDIAFLDLGVHRLRDLAAPVHLYQASHPSLPQQFPPLRSLDAVANNLPAMLSSFVGREKELDELKTLLEKARLLTITGVGGVGKTRLALQLAADQAYAYGAGVWLVTLGGIADPVLILPEIASTLRLGEQSGRSWLDSITWFLREREVLLVLDNCEHVLQEVASLVEAVLSTCRRVTILVTSREALNVTGEVTWTAPPLAVSSGPIPSEAETLFLSRARSIDPAFIPSVEETSAIAHVCRRLDGIPLAIELAAARIRILSVAEIASRLDDRFRLLTGGSRTALPRQRTLEATVRWSYELLEPPEQQLFDRLSVFAASFTLEAVEQVCVGGLVDATILLDLISCLVERSLIVHEGAATPSRYRLLETMRAYGRERLAEHGTLAEMRDRHLHWMNEHARALALDLDGPQQDLWLDRIALELDDVRSALTWACDGNDATTGLACAATLYRYWYIRAVREGRQWLDRLLAAAGDAPAKILAKGLYASGSLTELQGEQEAARSMLERSLALYREVGNDRGSAWALHGLGMAEWGIHEPAVVRKRFEDALSIFRRLGDPFGSASTLRFLGVWEAFYGDALKAVELVDEHAELVRPIQVPDLLAHAAELSAVARWRASGDYEQARPLLHEALRLYQQIGSVLCTAHCLEATAAWAIEVGAVNEAAILAGATEALREDAGIPVPAYESLYYEEAKRRLVAILGEECYSQQIKRGRSLDCDRAILAALALVESPSIGGEPKAAESLTKK